MARKLKPEAEVIGGASPDVPGPADNRSAPAPAPSPAETAPADTRAPVTPFSVEESGPSPANIARKRVRRTRAEIDRDRGNAQPADSQLAGLLLVLADGLAASVAGDECRMTAAERVMIAEPLARMLARMDSDTRARVDKWADPAALIMGLMVWGSRVARIKSAEADSQPQPAAAVAQPQPQPAAAVAQPQPLVTFGARADDPPDYGAPDILSLVERSANGQ